MLRLSLLILLLGNAGYFAWSHGAMASLGWTPENPSEAYRLQQQVRPEALRIRSPEELVAAPRPAPEPATTAPTAGVVAAPPHLTPNPAAALSEPSTVMPPPAAEALQCWQTDSLDEPLLKRLQSTLAAHGFAAAQWEVVTTAISGRWMVYLGKFSSDAALDKRRAELRARKIGFDRAGGPWDPGLSLGRFSSEEAAARELSAMQAQGIRGARVVQERTPHSLYTVRFAQLNTAQHTALQTLLPTAGSKPLRACPMP